MKVKIEGVMITLTESQISAIEKYKKLKLRSFKSFVKVLRFFRFKQDKEANNCFSRPGIHAEIIDYDGWHEVWMVGEGVKNSKLFPGGWQYSEPKELGEELHKATGGLQVQK